MRDVCLLLFLSVIGLSACGLAPPADTQGPKLKRSYLAGGETLTLEWDESLGKAQAEAEFAAGRLPVEVEEAKLKLPLPPSLHPGQGYRWSVSVTDRAGNPTSLQGTVLGPNPHPARLRLNEVRFAGSGKKPDGVELLVLEAGNLGGITLEYRGPGHERREMIFPDAQVAQGNYVIVLYKAGSASATRVYVQPGGKGLSAVAGVLSVRPDPQAPAVDQFVWSLRPGEGQALASQTKAATEVVEHSALGCTANRTWCRGKADSWLIVASGHASLGRANSLVPWVPKPSNRTQAPIAKLPKARKSPLRAKPISRVATSSRVVLREREEVALRPPPNAAHRPSPRYRRGKGKARWHRSSKLLWSTGLGGGLHSV